MMGRLLSFDRSDDQGGKPSVAKAEDGKAVAVAAGAAAVSSTPNAAAPTASQGTTRAGDNVGKGDPVSAVPVRN